MKKKKKAKHRRPAKGESSTSSKRVNRVEWIQSNLAVNHRHSHGSFVYIFRVPISDFSRRTVTPMFFSPRKPSTTIENNFHVLRNRRDLQVSFSTIIYINYKRVRIHMSKICMKLVRIIWEKNKQIIKILSLPCLHAIRYGIRRCQVASKYLLI